MAFYEPQNIDASKKSLEYKMALKESELYRGLMDSNERTFLDYKEWAKENVPYQQMAADDPRMQDALSRKLQKHNDAYTISLLMNCITPLQHGLDVDSVLSAYLSYKVIMTTNPDLNMNLSRMFSNMHGEMQNIADTVDIPGIHFMLKHLGKKLEKGMMEQSAEILSSEIEKAKTDHNLDALVMSPRQVAALKLNFMEQLYEDVRNCKGPEADLEVSHRMNEYSTALEHLNNIAINSGFTMDVVAAEERYLVGLRIQDDPSYAKMFEQTGDYYSAEPVLDDTGRWSGRFATRDGHEYNIADPNDLKQGAFTVRTSKAKSLEEVTQLIDYRARETTTMTLFLEDGDAETDGINHKAIEDAKNMVLNNFKIYQERLAEEFADDGLGTKEECLEYIKKVSQEASEAVIDSRKGSKQDNVLELFSAESELIIGREAMVYDHPDRARNPGYLESIRSDEVRQREWNDLTSDANKMYKDVDRSSHEVLADLRRHLIAGSTSKELYEHVMHVATNMNQSPTPHVYGIEADRKQVSGPKPTSFTGTAPEADKDTIQDRLDEMSGSAYDEENPDNSKDSGDYGD